MKLSIVIVNYNVRSFLFQCLRSVEAAIGGLDADVWVVDNASHDGSVDFLVPLFPHVHFIRNEANVGFSRANNAAIQLIQSDYVLLLNPDTIVSTKSLQDSVTWLDSHPDVGAVGVALHNSAGAFAWESRRGLPTPLVSFCKMSGLIHLFPRHKVIGRYYMRYLDKREENPIEIISGAFMMLRHKALDQVGLLDEDFFMYGEDIDLSYRLLKGGWKNYYLPHPIIHYKGESEHPSTIRYVNVFHQAMIIFYEKHFRNRYFLSGLLIRMAVYFKALITLLKHCFKSVFFFLPKRKSRIHYYGYCSAEHKADVERMVEERGATIQFMKEGEWPSRVPSNHYYLFDATVYSYDSIISTLVARHDAEPKLHLATYTPEIGILMP